MKSDHPTADAEKIHAGRLQLDRLRTVLAGTVGFPVQISFLGHQAGSLLAFIDRLSQKPATVSGEEPWLAELATANEHADILGERCHRLCEELAEAKREVAEAKRHLVTLYDALPSEHRALLESVDLASLHKLKARLMAAIESLRPAQSQSSGNSGEAEKPLEPVESLKVGERRVTHKTIDDAWRRGEAIIGGRCGCGHAKHVGCCGVVDREQTCLCKGTGQKPTPVATTLTGPSGKDVASQSRSTEGLRLAGSEDCGKGSAAPATESVGGDASARDQESKARHPGEAGHPIPPDDAERECPHGDHCCQSEPCKGPQVTCPHCNSDPVKVNDCKVCEGDGSVLAVQYIRDLALTARGQVAASVATNPDLP